MLAKLSRNDAHAKILDPVSGGALKRKAFGSQFSKVPVLVWHPGSARPIAPVSSSLHEFIHWLFFVCVIWMCRYGHRNGASYSNSRLLKMLSRVGTLTDC